jgi:hypothetical protein
MRWEDPRGGADRAPARLAHSDDAKARTDEAHQLRRSRSRARALTPALVGAVVAVIVVGGATAAWLSRGDGPSGSTPSTSGGPSGAPSSAVSSEPGTAVTEATPEPSTILPLEPVDEDVTYLGTIRCVEGGDFLLSQCPSVFQEPLECPDGQCTITFFVGPTLSRGGPDEGSTAITFTAGDPVVSFAGTDSSEPCPGRLNVEGTRRPDGGYEFRFVNGSRAGEFDGSCSPPSDSVFEVSLDPPA